MLLPSFYIENFRLFDTLEVKRLSRINLLVGLNNVGKSAFLEAVYIYASGADAEVFSELIQFRQEDWELNRLERGKGFAFSPFRHFFKGHQIPSLNESGFKLGIKKEHELLLHIKIEAYRYFKNQNGQFARERVVTPNDVDIEESFTLPDGNFIIKGKTEIYIIAEQKNQTSLLFSEEQGFFASYRRGLLNSKRSNPFSTIQFVPTQGISDKAAELWDEISADLEAIVIEGLQLVKKNLLNLKFVKNENSENDRTPLVGLKGQQERVPLKSLGDGVTRVFHIMLALVNAKDGVLLIDEFENGLHWTVQESVWRVLFTMAAKEKLNVQVFCTTHSRDCIQAFGTIWQEFENDGAFFRLYNHNNEIRVREYDVETLSDSLDMNVDVR